MRTEIWYLKWIILSFVTLIKCVPFDLIFHSSAKIVEDNLIITEGEIVSLKCEANFPGKYNITLEWKNAPDEDNSRDYSSKLYNYDSTFVNVNFSAVRRLHNMKIFCASKFRNSSIERSLLLKVYYLTNITAYVVPLTVVSGSRAALVCKADGRPPINRTWTKNGSSWKTESKEIILFNNVTKNEAGSYKCTVSNSIGSKSMIVKLKIKGDSMEADLHPRDAMVLPIIQTTLAFSILIIILLLVVLTTIILYLRHIVPARTRKNKRHVLSLPVRNPCRPSRGRPNPQLTTNHIPSIEVTTPRTSNDSALSSKLTKEHPYVNTTHPEYMELVDNNCVEDNEDILYESPGESCFNSYK